MKTDTLVSILWLTVFAESLAPLVAHEQLRSLPQGGRRLPGGLAARQRVLRRQEPVVRRALVQIPRLPAVQPELLLVGLALVGEARHPCMAVRSLRQLAPCNAQSL